jgi:hypothetical protein
MDDVLEADLWPAWLSVQFTGCSWSSTVKHRQAPETLDHWIALT